MTPDDLKAALLLLGFERTPNHAGLNGDLYRFIDFGFGLLILVRFNPNPNNVGVKYLSSGSPHKRRDFNSTPEAVFNFIKKVLSCPRMTFVLSMERV